MEKRIGTILIVVSTKESVDVMNRLISDYSSIILGRQGLPSRVDNRSIISLVIEGTNDEIGALSGKLGRLNGIEVKSAVIKNC